MPGEIAVCQKQNDGLSLIRMFAEVEDSGSLSWQRSPAGYTLVRARLHPVRSLGPSSITAGRCTVLAKITPISNAWSDVRLDAMGHLMVRCLGMN